MEATPLPRGFFETPVMQEALARYDFGFVFRAVRRQTAMSQMQLSELIGISQSRVSAVELGTRAIKGAEVAARISTALAIPGRLLGFHDEPRSPTVNENKGESWVDRRDFIGLVTAAALGSNLHPELARLATMLPGSHGTKRRVKVGAPDVQAVNAVTEGFRRWDLAHGGGLCRMAALSQLHQVRELSAAACDSGVRTGLQVATAELASMAGWMAFDAEDHDAARRLWTYALDLVRTAEDHPRSTDLAVSLLLDLAQQALHLRQAPDALKIVRLASAMADTRKHPAAPATDAYISTVLAWCWGALGEVDATLRAIGKSQERYASAESAWYISDAEISTQHAHAIFLLAVHDKQHAPMAISQLTHGIRSYQPEYARSKAVNIPTLATAHFLAGDPATGAAIGLESVSAITALSSARSYGRLRDLANAARPFADQPEVAHMRDSISTALAVA